MSIHSTDEIKYGIIQETTFGTLPTLGADNALYVTELPINIPIGYTENITRKGTGVPYQKIGAGLNFRKLNQKSAFTIPFHVNADNLTLILASLFQNVGIAGAAPYVYTFNPYTSSTHRIHTLGDVANFFGFSIIKQNVSTGTGEYVSGCITRSVTIECSEDNILTCSAEIIPLKYDTSDTLTSAGYVDFGRYPIIFSDFGSNVYIDTVAIDLMSMRLTITNNARPFYFTNKTPQKTKLGLLDVTSEIVLPWESNTYKDGVEANTDYLFEIYKGSKTGATAGDLYIQSNFVPNDAPESDLDNMKIITLPGTGANDGTNPAVQIILATSASRLTDTY